MEGAPAQPKRPGEPISPRATLVAIAAFGALGWWVYLAATTSGGEPTASSGAANAVALQRLATERAAERDPEPATRDERAMAAVYAIVLAVVEKATRLCPGILANKERMKLLPTIAGVSEREVRASAAFAKVEADVAQGIARDGREHFCEAAINGFGAGGAVLKGMLDLR